MFKTCYKDIIEDLRGLLKIPSVQGEPLEGKPFGKYPAAALKYMLDLGVKLGFKVKDVDGYAGHIEWGEGEDVFGVLCHLDVVPAGDDWTYPPFSATIDNGRIYARGAQDNKAPAISALYAAKRLMDEGFVPKQRFRLILGLNEESGWKCIDYYFKKEQMPEQGFSPDADFPVINCEKGVLHLAVSFPLVNPDTIEELSGGHRVNMVPDRAHYKLKTGILKRFEGVSAHGSTPHKGQNAVWELLSDLKQKVSEPAISQMYELFCQTGGLGKMGLDIADDVSGPLTLNLGTIFKKDDGTVVCGVDIRYPVTFNQDDILNKMRQALMPGAVVNVENYHLPLYVKADDPLVQSLLKAYREVTGDSEGDCISIGGATYSRALKKGVAFGPVFPGEESRIHTSDESIELDKFFKMTEIYYKALKELL